MPRIANVVNKVLGRGAQQGAARPESQLLAQVHQQLFGEPVTPAAIAAWSHALDTGVTFQFLLFELLYSRDQRPLAIEDFVESAYVALLGRSADAAGAAGFISAMGGLTMSPRGFLEELVNSEEFRRRQDNGQVAAARSGKAPSDLPAGVDAADGTPASQVARLLVHPTLGPALLNSLYEAASGGRTAPGHLIANLASQLRSGAAPADVLGALLAGVSSPYKVDGAALIASGYLAVLGRTPSDTDVEGYLRGLISGDLTPVSFLDSLMDSQEFRNRLPGHRVIGPVLLRPLYESIVGEPMPNGVLATWLEELNCGADFDLLVKNLRAHNPARAALNPELLALAFLGLQGKVPVKPGPTELAS